MLVLKKRKGMIKLEEIYYCDDYRTYKSDYLVGLFIQSKKASPNAKKYITLHIDLTKSEEELLKAMESKVRNAINRIEKDFDLVKYTMLEEPTDADIDDFCYFYNSFAAEKGIAGCSKTNLENLAQNKSLRISFMQNELGAIICYHTYIDDGIRSRTLQSASHFRDYQDSKLRSFVGMINRTLHWNDMKYFKKKGIQVYDFGGLTVDPKNEEMSNIDRFKKGFGGEQVTEYSFYYSPSIIGKLMIAIADKKIV